MGVPSVFERAERACIDLHFDLRCPYILRIVGDGASNTAEATVHIRDHHVTDAELCTRVCGIDLVICKHGILLRPSKREGSNYLDIEIDASPSAADASLTATEMWLLSSTSSIIGIWNWRGLTLVSHITRGTEAAAPGIYLVLWRA